MTVETARPVRIEDGSRVVYRPMVLDGQGFCVTVNGQDVPVTYVEFLLLNELVHHPFQVLSPDRLLSVLNSARREAPAPTSPGALRTHVTRLRGKFARVGVPRIKTMRRVGYGFIPPAGDPVAARL